MVYGIGFTTSFRMMNLYGSLGFKTNGESWFVPKAASPDRYSREFRRWHGFNDEISVIQWKKIITGEMSTTPMVEMREQPLFASPFELLSWPHVVPTAIFSESLKQLKIQCFFLCFATFCDSFVWWHPTPFRDAPGTPRCPELHNCTSHAPSSPASGSRLSTGSLGPSKGVVVGDLTHMLIEKLWKNHESSLFLVTINPWS
jgi:hypothetical protein